ncbi:hypothetical protein [Chryseobacterium koreense]|uniref:hypothetical protein n=1 Tax=Chryseobacterium koreense TaxID=232216 RepID=UPI000B050175|nr:hypothetical protein [Chryseobacterium koreense]MBB5334497.1 hypothetical protein [Chryseobacterium koreense]
MIRRLFEKLKLIKPRQPYLPQTNVSGSLPLDKSHICFDKGHNMFLVTEIDNGRSKYGDHKCSRCGWVDSFQYDYGSW